MKTVVMGLVAAFLSTGVAAAQDAEIEAGREVYAKWCGPCHNPGTEHPGTLALQTRYQGEMPAALEARTDLTADTIRFFVRNGVSMMPFFRKTEINDAQLDALAAYLTRNRE